MTMVKRKKEGSQKEGVKEDLASFVSRIFNWDWGAAEVQRLDHRFKSHNLQGMFEFGIKEF